MNILATKFFYIQNLQKHLKKISQKLFIHGIMLLSKFIDFYTLKHI